MRKNYPSDDPTFGVGIIVGIAGTVAVFLGFRALQARQSATSLPAVVAREARPDVAIMALPASVGAPPVWPPPQGVGIYGGLGGPTDL